MSETYTVKFVPSGRGKAQCAPDPNYPNGIIVTAAKEGEQQCVIPLPYPAPECGHFLVRCDVCRLAVVITAAGRPDDPVQVVLPCTATQTRTYKPHVLPLGGKNL